MEPGSPSPRVSVVIPTYNRARMVCGAIESVLAQTLTDFELIVVDDGSTDDTGALLEERFGAEPRFRYFRQENGGSASARQRGLSHACADLLALLDSDDRYLPRFLESQVAFLGAHPEVDLALCDARREGAWGDRAETIFGDPRWNTPDSLEVMANAGWALPSASMLRTEAAREVGFDSDMNCSEDTDFLWRFHIAGLRLAENREVLTRYLRHAGEGDAAQKIDDAEALEKDRLAMLLKYVEHVPNPRNMVCEIYRLQATRLERQGERGKARGYYWKWWRTKPASSKALRGLLRNLWP